MWIRRMSYTRCSEDPGWSMKRSREETYEVAGANACTDDSELASTSCGKRDGQRGSIDFDFPETKVILNEKGEPDRDPSV